MFRDAEVAVERAGGYGTTTLIELRDAWPRTRVYEHVDDDSTERHDLTGAMGFPMTSVTRPLVLAALDVLLRETPECLRDPELVGEMRTFVTTKSGKLAADTGCHDDRVMARAIAAWVRNLRATRRDPGAAHPGAASASASSPRGRATETRSTRSSLEFRASIRGARGTNPAFAVGRRPEGRSLAEGIAWRPPPRAIVGRDSENSRQRRVGRQWAWRPTRRRSSVVGRRWPGFLAGRWARAPVLARPAALNLAIMHAVRRNDTVV